MWQKTMFSFVNNTHNSFVNPELINNVQRNGVLYMQYFANDLSSTAEQYFLNMHIFDICTNDLQSNNFLSWKLQEKISVQQRYLFGCRPPYHFNNWNFPLHNSVKKNKNKKNKNWADLLLRVELPGRLFLYHSWTRKDKYLTISWQYCIFRTKTHKCNPSINQY